MTEKEYEVGYGKPPAQQRWKKGESGNPKGRRARAKTVDENLSRILDERVKLPDGVSMPMRELIIRRGLREIVDGKVKQWPSVFELLRKFDGKAVFTPTTADEKRLAELLDNLRTEAAGEKVKGGEAQDESAS